MLDRPDIHGVVIVTPTTGTRRWPSTPWRRQGHPRRKADDPLLRGGEEVYETAGGPLACSGRPRAHLGHLLAGESPHPGGQDRKVVWARAGSTATIRPGLELADDPTARRKTLTGTPSWARHHGGRSSRSVFPLSQVLDYSGASPRPDRPHAVAMQICVGRSSHEGQRCRGIYVHHDRETPDTFSMQVEYPASIWPRCSAPRPPRAASASRFARERHHHLQPTKEKPGKVLVTPEAPFASRCRSWPSKNSSPGSRCQLHRVHAQPGRDPLPALVGYKVMVALGLACEASAKAKCSGSIRQPGGCVIHAAPAWAAICRTISATAGSRPSW